MVINTEEGEGGVMDQLTLFEAPAAVRPKKTGRHATSSVAPGVVSPPKPTDNLPTKPKQLLELVRSELLPAYDVAIADGDAEKQIDLRARIMACVGRHGNAETIKKAISAPAGAVPSWSGVGSELRLTILGCEVIAHYSGLLGYGTVPIISLGTVALNDDAPFFSETGFQSFSWDLGPRDFIATGGLSWPEWIVTLAEKDLRQRGAQVGPMLPKEFRQRLFGRAA